MQYRWALLPLVLSTIILLAARQVAQPPEASSLKPKIFVLGLSKTGTTSIGDALALLGYKRLGWKDIRSRHLVHSWTNGDYDALIEQTRYFDAFEDLPWPMAYRAMAEKYPDAKFVLSLRKDDETWLASIRRHVGRGAWQPHQYFYGTTHVDGHEDEALVLQAYRNHTAHVRDYFRAQPHRYAELTIDDGDANWAVLCRLAEYPAGRVPAVAFPRSNAAAHWSQGTVLDTAHFLWSWTITRIEELSVDSMYRGGWSGVNVLLSACWDAVDVIEQACSELYFKYARATSAPLAFVDV